jgi:long-chain acyl-CoA synthetase
MLRASARRVPTRVFLRFLDPRGHLPQPRTLTFSEFEERVRRAVAWLRSAGLQPGERLLLIAENSPEWQILAIACQTLRAEAAALFSNLDPGPAMSIAKRVRPRVVFASTTAQWSKLAPAANDLAAVGLRAVLCSEPLDVDRIPGGVAATTVSELLETPPISGSEMSSLVEAVQPSDPFLLIFTSGTTGRQKGVRIAQGGLAGAVDGAQAAASMTEADDGLHFLPFAHIAGQAQFALAVALGHPLIQVARREDIQKGLELGPTYVFSVPLVYERIWTAVEAQVAARPGLVRRLLQSGMAAAARVACDGSRNPFDRLLGAIARKLVGSKLRQKLGGGLRALFAGGAPTLPAMQRFFEAMGIPYVEFYGMSETSGLISANSYEVGRRAGTVGLPHPALEVKIDEDGELCVKGPLCMTGYLEKEDEEGCVTPDGYFRTGDLAAWDPDGMLRIVGRKKHLFVLSTGKKLSPEPIEQAIASGPPFEGAVLLGDGRPFVTVAVFVSRSELQRLQAEGEVEAKLLEIVHARLGDFSEYEKPKRLIIIPGTVQDEPSILTPTFKVNREAFAKWRSRDIAEIYEAQRPAPASASAS